MQCVGVLKAVSFRKGFCDLIFPLIHPFFNFADDLEYERAFAALDKLNLSCLKSFFKEKFLQVLKIESSFVVLPNCFSLLFFKFPFSLHVISA